MALQRPPSKNSRVSLALQQEKEAHARTREQLSAALTQVEEVSKESWARAEGQAAALAGRGMDACPHTDDPKAAHYWLEGWRYIYLQGLTQFLRAAIRLIEQHHGAELVSPVIISELASREIDLPPAAWATLRATYTGSAEAFLSWGSFDYPAMTSADPNPADADEVLGAQTLTPPSVLAVLKQTAPLVCGAECPTVKKTGTPWEHTPACLAVLDAIALLTTDPADLAVVYAVQRGEKAIAVF